MMSSTLNVTNVSSMGQKSKKIFAKRFDEDFGEMNLSLKDSISIENSLRLLVALGFIKPELRIKPTMDSKLVDELLALVKAPK